MMIAEEGLPSSSFHCNLQCIYLECVSEFQKAPSHLWKNKVRNNIEILADDVKINCHVLYPQFTVVFFMLKPF